MTSIYISDIPMKIAQISLNALKLKRILMQMMIASVTVMPVWMFVFFLNYIFWRNFWKVLLLFENIYNYYYLLVRKIAFFMSVLFIVYLLNFWNEIIFYIVNFIWKKMYIIFFLITHFKLFIYIVNIFVFCSLQFFF